MKTLVTGSKGYIGENLTRYLNSAGIEVEDVDHKRNAWSISAKDLKDIDFVIHLAAAPGIKYCEENPKIAFSTNVYLTYHLIKVCNLTKTPIILMSSQAAKDPVSSIYAMTKFICELAAVENKYIGVLRLANVYGGYGFSKKSSVVSKFIEAYKEGTSVVINGNGRQKRDFIHVYDVCRAIYRLMTQMMLGKTFNSIDIGTGNGISILELANMFNLNYTINNDQNQVGIVSNIVDPSIARNLIGFKHSIEMKDYIKTYILGLHSN
jgi:UDP-glucose 4-epimerase